MSLTEHDREISELREQIVRLEAQLAQSRQRDRHASEAASCESEARHRQIVETANEGRMLVHAEWRIAARIAHEINNPLAGIKNSFLLIKDTVPRDHAYFKYVARIDCEIDRIAHIVRQLLHLCRPGDVTPRDMELSATLHDVVAMLDTVASARDVTFQIDVLRVPGPVRLPEDSFRQILVNVIVNALEASPAGGVVKIRASWEHHRLELLVSDQGAGVPAELRSQIFEPFFTTKNVSGTGGLGLGLSLSRSLVAALQGTLDFESTPGRGSVFRISLPLDPLESESLDDG